MMWIRHARHDIHNVEYWTLGLYDSSFIAGVYSLGKVYRISGFETNPLYLWLTGLLAFLVILMLFAVDRLQNVWHTASDQY